MSSAAILRCCGECVGPAYGCGDYDNAPTCMKVSIEGFTESGECFGFVCSTYTMYPNREVIVSCDATPISQCGGAGVVAEWVGSPEGTLYPIVAVGELLGEGKFGITACFNCDCYMPDWLWITFVATSGDLTSDPSELAYEYYDSAPLWDTYFGTDGTMVVEAVDCPT